MATNDDSPVTVQFYTRSMSAAPERRGAVLEWLERLHAEGTIDGFSLDTWPVEVEYGGDHGVLDLFSSFEAWGERVGATVRPPFQVRTHRSLLGEPEREVLVTPELCLAAYRGDELVAVRPCHRDGQVDTIEEYLSSLELTRHATAATRAPSVQTQ